MPHYLTLLASLAPWVALIITLLIKIADYRVGERQRIQDERRSINAEEIKSISSDTQHLIDSLISEKDKIATLYETEINKRRQAEDTLDMSRQYIFGLRALAREILLGNTKLDGVTRLLLSNIAGGNSGEEDDGKNHEITPVDDNGK